MDTTPAPVKGRGSDRELGGRGRDKSGTPSYFCSESPSAGPSGGGDDYYGGDYYYYGADDGDYY